MGNMVRNISHTYGRIAGAVAGVALLATTAACGGSSSGASSTGSSSGSSSTGSSNSYTQAQKDQVAKSLMGADIGFSHSQAECVSGKVLGSIGIDKLKKYGLASKTAHAAPNLPPKDANSVAGAMTSCADMVSLFIKQNAPRATASQKSCLKSAISQDQIRQALAASFSGHEQDMGKYIDKSKVQACKKA